MHIFRKILFIFLLSFLLTPIIQSSFHLFTITRLSGGYLLTSDTNLTYKGWFSGKYQTHKELYLRDTFGLRSIFIRSRNQVDYDLFQKINSTDFVIGKNDDIFPTWYLEAYKGWNFVGSNKLKIRMDKLKYIQDTLAKLNKTILLVIAPSKNLFQPEDIPVNNPKGDSTNYEASIRLLKNEGLNYIDFNHYFIEQKNKTPYPLFYKYDSHWTDYGACLAGDSIMSMLEKLRNTKTAHTLWKNSITREKASGDETELEKDLNLLFPLDQDTLGHPHPKNPADTNVKKLSALVIGDSYIWGLGDHYNFWNNFSTGYFCYYYNLVYPTHSSSSIPIDKFNLKDAIKSDDVLIIESTETKMNEFGWGFIDSAYTLFNGHPIIDSSRYIYVRKMEKYKADIKSNKKWLTEVENGARKQGISIDSALTLNAIWLIQNAKN